MSNLTSTLTLKLVDDGLAAKAKADADALKKLGASEKDLKKLGSAGRSVSDLNKHLDGLAHNGERLDKFKAGAKNVRDLGVASRKARADVAATAKAVAALGEGADPRKLAAATRAQEKALKRQSKAREDFAVALQAQRGARSGALGGRGNSIAAAEAKIASETHAANAALREQLALVGRIAAKEAAERRLAGGMGAGGRAQLDRIEANRRLKDGMSAAGRGGMPVVLPNGGGSSEEHTPHRKGAQDRREAEREAKRRAHEQAEQRAGLKEGVMGGLGLHHLGALAAGVTAYKAGEEIIESQAHRQHEQVRQRASGLSGQEVRENAGHAAELSGKYRAFSQTEIMHGLRNARSIVGDFEEAQAVMEPMLKLRTIALGAHPEQREELEADFDNLIKGMEIKGVTQDMPKFMSYMNGMAKAVNTFGDTLRPTDYYEMFKYGRQSTQGLSEDYMNTVAPTLAQELSGSGAGTAQSAFFQAIVGGKMSNVAAKELVKMGLVDPDKIERTKTGNVKGIKPGGVKGADLAASNPYEWVQQYLLPALEKHGITDPQKIQEEIAHVFSKGTAAQMVSLFATQQSRIEKDAHLVHGSEGLEAAQRFQRDDPLVTRQAVRSQLENFWSAFGGEKFEARIEGGLAKGLARAVEALAEHQKDRDAGKDRMLSEKNLDKLNRLLVPLPEDNRTAAQRQADEDAGAVTDRKNAIAEERDRLGEHLKRLQDVDDAGGLGARFGKAGRAKEKEALRARIEQLEQDRTGIDEAVARRDWARDNFDRNAADRKAADVQFSRRNEARAVNPVGAFGLHGAAGLDQPGPAYAAQPTGPMSVPLPPRRPANIGGEVPQQLKDVRDILGGGTDGLNPIIAPKVDTTQIEGVTPKVDAAKEKFSELGSASARPTVDTSSISEAIGLVQQLANALGAIGPAAAGARSQIASVQAPRRGANPGWIGSGDYTTA